jgi:hypothetical protein
MPLTVALTPSVSVGVSSPVSLWAYRIAATRRPMVEGLAVCASGWERANALGVAIPSRGEGPVRIY